MIPAAGPAQRQDVAATDGELLTIQSIRKLKEKRKAIAQAQIASARVQEPSVSSINNISSFQTLQAKVTGQQLEITHLKKEREDITGRLMELETQYKRLSNVAISDERENDKTNASVLLEPVLVRLNALEQLGMASKLTDFQKDVEKLQPALGRLTALEQSQELPVLRQDVKKFEPILGRVDKLEKTQTSKLSKLEEQIKALSDRIDGLDATTSKSTMNALTKISTDLKSDIQTLKTSTGMQGTDIQALKDWRNTQPKTMSEWAIKKLVFDQAESVTKTCTNELDQKVNSTESKLTQRINSIGKELSDLTSKTEIFQTFMKSTGDKIVKIEENDANTYAKASRLDKDVNTLFEFKASSKEDMQRLDDRLFFVEKDVDKSLTQGKANTKKHDKLCDSIAKFMGPIEEQFKGDGKTLVQRTRDLGTTVERLIPLKDKFAQLHDDIMRSDADQSGIVSNVTKLTARLDSMKTTACASPIAPIPKFHKVGKPVASSLAEPIENSTTITNPRMDQFDRHLKELESALREDGSLMTKVTDVKERLESVEQDASEKMKALDAKFDAGKSEHSHQVAHARAEQTKLAEKLSLLETRIASLSNAQPDVANLPKTDDLSVAKQDILDMQQRLTELESDVESTDHQIFDQKTLILAVQESVPKLFQDNFVTLKQTSEQRFAGIDSKLDAQNAKIDSLQARPQPLQSGLSDAQQRQLNSVTTEAERLKAEISELNLSLQRTTATQDRTLESRLATKADKLAVDQQMNGLALAVQNLTARYENITTEELHRQSDAKIMQDLSRMKQEFANLKYFEPQLSWLNTVSKDLSQLASKTPQLLELVSHADTLVNTIPAPQTLEKIERACSDARTALAKTEQQSKNLAYTHSVVSGLQTSFHNLCSDAGPITRVEALSGLQNTVIELRGFINELSKDVNTALKPRLDTLELSSGEHRQRFETVNSTLIEPNREFFVCLGAVFTTLCQLQDIVKGLNQNLPTRPLDFEFHYNLSAFVNSRRDGKSKQ
jgi:hypothetical protein